MRSQLFLFLLFFTSILSTHTALAQVVAPSQGGEVELVLVTSTTMELSFGSTGNGQARVVSIAVSNFGMPVSISAVDNQRYIANSTYGAGSAMGKGFVVYNGTDHSTTVVGLQPGTWYYVVNTEYNSDGVNIAYKQGGNLATSTRTAAQQSATPVTPLPVELTAFNGEVGANSLASLHWNTASEYKSAYFAIERSVNGTTFVQVGQVSAAGASNKSLAYHWSDPQPLTNTTYYRLRQVDLDGTMRFSNIVTLAPITTPSKLAEIYPNPSAGQPIQLLLQGYGDESITLQLTDALGRTVLTQTLTSVDLHYLAPLLLPGHLALGTYALTIASKGSSIHKHIIVSN